MGWQAFTYLLILLAISAYCFPPLEDDSCADISSVCHRNLDKCSKPKTSAWYRWAAKECRKTCNFCKWTPTNPPPTEKYIPPTNCGKSSVPNGRIIGGSVSLPGRWPWIVRLYEADSTKSFCGGALISPKWVVTASHCLYGELPENIAVHLGRHSIDPNQATDPSVQIIRAKRIILHPEFAVPTRMNNDVALIELSKPAYLNDRVRTICLPNHNHAPNVGKKCFLAGWGKTSHPGKPSPLLRQTDLDIVDNYVCKRLNRRHYRIPVTKNMLCAGLGPMKVQGACHGDSGGPLMCEENGRYFLHGAVSWGPSDCQSSKAYSVFAQINLYRKWIDSYIK